MNFDQAFQMLIGFEGAYSNDPHDPGGETKFGISKRSYPHLDIKNLTLEQAKAIYLSDFWTQSLAPNFPEPLRFQLFDCAVNSGPEAAVRLLQRALGVVDDGHAGPKTMEAVSKISNTTKLAILFLAQRLRYMTHASAWESAGRGWANRIASNLEEAAHEL